LRDRYPTPLPEQVIAILKDQRLLDDAAFASQWRASREQHRPRAAAMLRQELRGLGVDPEAVSQALQGVDDPANCYRAGQRVAQRWAGQEWQEFRQHMMAHLMRRGFGRALALETATRLWAELSSNPLDSDKDANGQE